MAHSLLFARHEHQQDYAYEAVYIPPDIYAWYCRVTELIPSEQVQTGYPQLSASQWT